ncbi:unnamed protein product [Kuraishia capsulata CBS 1993]|uniref:Zn(2)-C6 fungal-type domain-containing protein n=1 Tax=Kuraishia capsulata CBS 1993 TaxID=1382522 RepID=W6MY59_9ASCO|nr:uncharacterized protein KUCA_T00006060001 [Kuraishia capsulata CBS 1993]CDK30065.1 unnamed protein product [Kuraishia capsulata CBS 1993]
MAPSSKKKRRTLTGCWTCRLRKVKCDSGRPFCKRCEKARVQCQGYDIKLNWLVPLSIALDGSFQQLDGFTSNANDIEILKRGKIDFVKFPPSMTYRSIEIDSIMESLSEEQMIHAHSKLKRIGPFAVFRLVETGRNISDRGHLVTHSGTPTPINYDQVQINSLSNVTSVKEDSVWIDPSLLTAAQLTYRALTGISVPSEVSLHRLKQVLFSRYYDKEETRSIRYFSKLKQKERSTGVKKCLIELLIDSDIPTPQILDGDSTELFHKVISCKSIQSLVLYFTQNARQLLLVCFENGFIQKSLIPIVLKFLGEALIDFNDQTIDDQTHNHPKSLRMCCVMQCVAMAAAFKSYSSSEDLSATETEKYLGICFRARSAALLLISSFFVSPINSSMEGNTNGAMDKNLIEMFLHKDLVKELTTSLLLQYFLDSHLDAIVNYGSIFKALEQITASLSSHPLSTENDWTSKYQKDKSLQNILRWATYVWEIHRSTSTIDLQNYSVDGDDYADILDHNYNLVEFSAFYDKETPPENTKIHIKPISSAEVSEDDDFSSNGETPPKRFAIQFNYDESSDSEGEETEDLSDSADVRNHSGKNFGVIMDKDHASEFPSLGAGLSQSDISSIELLCGVPRSLLILLNKCSTLANHRNFFMRKNLHPRNFPKICCDIEEELKNWRLDWDLLIADGEMKEDMTENTIRYKSRLHEVMFHSAMCFHDSLVVYFYRLLKDISPALLRSRVESCIDHLEKLTSLSEDTDHNMQLNPSRHFWPFFICGCDAIGPSVQQRYLALFERWRSTKWIGKQIMLEVWRSRSESDEEKSWIDVIKDWKFTTYH